MNNVELEPKPPFIIPFDIDMWPNPKNLTPEPSGEQVKLGRFRYKFSSRTWIPKDGRRAWFIMDYGPEQGHFKERWLVHDENEFCAGEFTSKEDAMAACERWTIGRADLLTVEWRKPSEDADDSDRGTYIGIVHFTKHGS